MTDSEQVKMLTDWLRSRIADWQEYTGSDVPKTAEMAVASFNTLIEELYAMIRVNVTGPLKGARRLPRICERCGEMVETVSTCCLCKRLVCPKCEVVDLDSDESVCVDCL